MRQGVELSFRDHDSIVASNVIVSIATPPDIQHEALAANLPAEGTPGGGQPEPAQRPAQVEPPEAGSENPQVTHDPDHTLSFQRHR